MEGETIEHLRLTSSDIDGDGDRGTLETALGAQPGVRAVTVNPNDHTVEVAFDPREVSVPKLKEILIDNGYNPDQEAFGDRRDEVEGDHTATP